MPGLLSIMQTCAVVGALPPPWEGAKLVRCAMQDTALSVFDLPCKSAWRNALGALPEARGAGALGEAVGDVLGAGCTLADLARVLGLPVTNTSSQLYVLRRHGLVANARVCAPVAELADRRTTAGRGFYNLWTRTALGSQLLAYWAADMDGVPDGEI